MSAKMNVKFYRICMIIMLIVAFPVSVPYLLCYKGHKTEAYMFFAVEAFFVLYFSTYYLQSFWM